jgi:hypothetical protein
MAEEDDLDDCPLCVEPLDATDKSFRPCKCGFRVRESLCCSSVYDVVPGGGACAGNCPVLTCLFHGDLCDVLPARRCAHATAMLPNVCSCDCSCARRPASAASCDSCHSRVAAPVRFACFATTRSTTRATSSVPRVDKCTTLTTWSSSPRAGTCVCAPAAGGSVGSAAGQTPLADQAVVRVALPAVFIQLTHEQVHI